MATLFGICFSFQSGLVTESSLHCSQIPNQSCVHYKFIFFCTPEGFMKLNFCILTPKWESQTKPDPYLTKLCGSWSAIYCILLFYFYYLSTVFYVVSLKSVLRFKRLREDYRAMGGFWAFSFWQKKVSVKKCQW